MPEPATVIATRPDQTIESLYGANPGLTLLVEPLSSRQTLAMFLKEGGIGWHSFAESSLVSTARRIATDRFEYGAKDLSLYNVGYPLHRLLEGPRGQAPTIEPGAIRSLEFLTRQALTPNLAFKESGPDALATPIHRGNAFYINRSAAPLFGLDKAGIAHATPCKELDLGAPFGWKWEERFFLDRVPGGQAVLKVLTQKSGFLKLAEVAPPSVSLFALVVHVEVIVPE